MLEDKIFKIGHEVGLRENNIIDQVKKLKKKETTIHGIRRDKYRIKSLTQTYDIRDDEKYHGILDLERQLQENLNMDSSRLTDKIVHQNVKRNQTLRNHQELILIIEKEALEFR